MKYTEEEWEYIVGDTWFHNEYYDLMTSILKDKDDNWIEMFKLTDDELRDIFKRIEGYWISKVEMLLWQGEEE
tara:strand:+ start:8479 stop:8697 length:219 start_codon:yes stop_codon:yes gene_type:complete